MKRDLVREDLERAREEMSREEMSRLNSDKSYKKNNYNTTNHNHSNHNHNNSNNNQDENEIEYELRQRRRKKITFTISLVLIFLMLSYIYLSAPVYTFILGYAGSSKLDGQNITFKNQITVMFNEETLNYIQDLYDPLGYERALCILGYAEDNSYFVEDYHKPIIVDRGWNYVTHSACPANTIIMLHTHPLKRCEPSQTDRNTLRAVQERNPKVIMIVMCGEERFAAVLN